VCIQFRNTDSRQAFDVDSTVRVDNIGRLRAKICNSLVTACKFVVVAVAVASSSKNGIISRVYCCLLGVKNSITTVGSALYIA
jgi:hypothetical protein